MGPLVLSCCKSAYGGSKYERGEVGDLDGTTGSKYAQGGVGPLVLSLVEV